MLRPATPLSLIFLVAFALLLLSTLSTPIIKAIPLGSYQGYNFGVFGWCKADTCSPFKIGYSTDGLFSGPNSNDPFSLSNQARHDISGILVVHPIAAFLSLVCFGLAVAAHFHAPSHSPRYLLALLILTIPTLIVTLLAFLVDILLFVPHLQWGGWIVLAATILIMASTVVACAMRRTVVSRKARKKRIAENADMNGANYYENLAQTRMMTDEQLPRADSPPPMSGTTATDKSGPQFAAFEMKRQDTRSEHGGRTSLDDRTPLNAREPSIRSASTGGTRRPYGPGEDAPPMPLNGRPSMDNGTASVRPPRDQYGMPIAAGAAAGAMGGAAAGMIGGPTLRHQDSQGSLGSRRSDAPPRGRAGYEPPPRGYGPPGPRGGYGPPRGGYGPRGGFRGGPGGPPPPSWNGRGRGGYGPPPGRGGPQFRPPPPGYVDPYYHSNSRNGPSPTNPNSEPPPPAHDQFIAGPIGQAIEMDERSGTRSPDEYPHDVQPSYGRQVSDEHVAGMMDMPQDRLTPSPMPMHGSHRSSDEPKSPTSVYSGNSQQYAPPREQWNAAADAHRRQAPSAAPSSGSFPLSPIQASPPTPMHRPRADSEDYYEDVDPRFASDAPTTQHAHTVPSSLMPGAAQPYPGPQHPAYEQSSQPLLRPDSDEIKPEHSVSMSLSPPTPAFDGLGAAGLTSMSPSPAPTDGSRRSQNQSVASDTNSHFTSISQRGINPNWRPPPSASVYSDGERKQAKRRSRDDAILNANPDFALPGPAGRGRGRGRGGLGAGGTLGLTPAGRYPVTKDVVP